MRKSNILTLLLFGFTALSWGQTYTISTVAGAPPVNATSLPNTILYAPEAVWVDDKGTVYIADSGGRRVYAVNQDTGKVTTVVGNLQNNNTDTSPTTANTASLQIPTGLYGDAAGNLYIADRSVSRIKKVTPDGKMSTIAGAGVPGSGNYSGADGYPASNEKGSVANVSSTNGVRGMCVDKVTGTNLYFADTGSHRVRKLDLTTLIITTIAGNTGSGPTITAAGSAIPGDGGPAILARLNAPEDVSCGPDGSIYIADTGNNRIRKVTPNGIISTLAGKTVVVQPSATVTNIGTVDAFGNPVTNVATISSSCSYSTTQSATVVPSTCGDGKLGTDAQFNSPSNLSYDVVDNLIYIADRSNNRIRKIDLTSGLVSTVVTGITAPGRFDLGPKGRLFIPEMGVNGQGVGTNVVKKYDPVSNQTSVFAGGAHFGGEGTLATGALFNQPTGIAVDGSGNVYISDTGNQRVRMVDTTGMISTIIGTGASGNNAVVSSKGQATTTFSGDGVSGTATKLNSPKGLAVDKAGNVYVADSGNHRILMWNAKDLTTSTVVGICCSASANTNLLSGAEGVTRITATTYGEGLAANQVKLNAPQGVAFDGAGNMYIADTGNHTIRKVSADMGSVVTIAGQAPVSGAVYPNSQTNFAGYSGDTYLATAALLNGPTNVAVSEDGKTIVIADTLNSVVRRIGADRRIHTILGVFGQNSGDTQTDRPGYALRLNIALGVGIDKSGNIWVSDMNNGRVKVVDGKTLFVTYPLGNSGTSSAGVGTLGTGAPAVGINWSADVANSPTTAVRLGATSGLAIGPDGTTAYIVDSGNGQIRKIVKNADK